MATAQQTALFVRPASVAGRGLKAYVLERFLRRCGAADCPRLHRLFPPYFGRAASLFFDGQWYCDADCAETSIAFRVQNALTAVVPEKPRNYRVPLGLLLVTRGVITQAQLREVLLKQRENQQGRLGQWLLQLGYISEAQLTAALARQWACPVYPLERKPLPTFLTTLAPFLLFQTCRAVPVHASADGKVLHLAFCDRIDHTLLYGLEQMLGCRTVGCVATEASVVSALESMAPAADREEISFDTLRDPRDIASTIRSYAQELRADRVAITRAGRFLWTRFHRKAAARDLLFRVFSSPDSKAEQFPPPSKGSFNSADTRKDGVSHALELV